jgi:hypothetical protein
VPVIFVVAPESAGTGRIPSNLELAIVLSGARLGRMQIPSWRPINDRVRCVTAVIDWGYCRPTNTEYAENGFVYSVAAVSKYAAGLLLNLKVAGRTPRKDKPMSDPPSREQRMWP